MLYPYWVQPRLGPLLRGGIDINCYANQILLCGLFKKREEEVSGVWRLLHQFTAKKVPEPDNLYSMAQYDSENVIIEFKGDKEHFRNLEGWDEFLLKALFEMTQSRWYEIVNKIKEVPIGINVRLGNDFKEAEKEEDYYTKGAIKTPLKWFVESLKLIRAVLGFPAKAYVVSDGTESSLRELLTLENVYFQRPGCAITDLLVLAKSQILIASGGSSFSAWASFLGQMPTISYPGQSLGWFKINNKKGYFVGEFQPDAPTESFLNCLDDLQIKKCTTRRHCLL
jgi:hypothetical protein